jgi:hypothetical protein
MRKRLDYIETEHEQPKSLGIEPTEPLDSGFHYPLLAAYDFLGNGPRRGNDSDGIAYGQAKLLRTRGEKLSPVLLRVALAVLRLLIGLIILFFILRGNTFTCSGTRYTFS